jgi:periplasmic mercuric ion binding protein
MKATFVSVMAVLAVVVSARAADVTAKLSDVHLCCNSCVKGVEKAVGTVPDAKASVDKDAGTVELTGPDRATVQKAVDALVEAGYFGKSSDSDIKIKSETGATGNKVQSLQVSGVHLCCGKCVKAVNEALSGVPGVKANTAAKGVKTFEVTGDFNDKDVFTALQKAGLTGTVAK